MTSGPAKRMLLHSVDFRCFNVFGRTIRWKSVLRSVILFASTARSLEDETRNARRNANRNPEWWEDFSQLHIQIKPKSGFEFVPRDTEEFTTTKISIRMCTARY